MKRLATFAVVLLAGVLAVALVQAQDAPADQPTKTEKTEKRAVKKAVRLTKPWSGLSSLSDDQKTQIAAIHAKTLEQIKAIQAEEKEQILALLTPEQKAELTAIEEKAKSEQKAKKAPKDGGAEKKD